MTIITWHDTCHLSLMTFLLLVLCGLALASIHHRAAHACSTHSSCPHLSIGQGAERGVCRGCGGVCPVSAIYNSSTVWSPFSVGGFGQNSRTRNNIPFCAAQKYPEKGKLTERNCADAFVWRGNALDPCCSARLGISWRCWCRQEDLEDCKVSHSDGLHFIIFNLTFIKWSGQLISHSGPLVPLPSIYNMDAYLLFNTQIVTLPYCVCLQCFVARVCVCVCQEWQRTPFAPPLLAKWHPQIVALCPWGFERSSSPAQQCACVRYNIGSCRFTLMKSHCQHLTQEILHSSTAG